MQGVSVSHFTKSFAEKYSYLVIRLISQKSKTNYISKNVISRKTLKQNRFTRKGCCENSELMSVLVFIFRKAGEVFNFTKDRLRLVVSLAIWKFFRTDISCTPSASYFLYYVIPRSFLLDTSLYFDGDAGRSLLSVCLIIFLQGHLLFPIYRANKN